MTLKHAKNSAKSDTGDATIVQPSDWNADHVVNEGVDFPDESPATPTGTKGRWHGRNLANRRFGVVKSPNGYDYTGQPHIGRNQVAFWIATGSNAVPSAVGGIALTSTGTATATNPTSTNRYTRSKRSEHLVSAAATTAVAGLGMISSAGLRWTIGNGATEGGFFFIIRGGPATGVTNTSHRFAMGMLSSAVAPTDVNPSTLAGSILLGYDSADTQWQIISHNTTSATKVALGGSFPKPSADRVSMMELTLYCAPSDTVVYWVVQDIISGAIATGTIAAANLPPNSTFLGPRIYASVGGVSSVVGIAFQSAYIESEF